MTSILFWENMNISKQFLGICEGIIAEEPDYPI